MKTILLVIMMLASVGASAADRVGNGGDLVRAAFFATGEEIIGILERDALETQLIYKYEISVEKLRSALTIEMVRVVDTVLYDNGGSVVDALGSPEGIILSRSTWMYYIRRGESLHKIVFHELLRAQGINDDNYRISKQLPVNVTFPKRPKTRYGQMYLAFKSAELEPIGQSIPTEGSYELACDAYFSDGSKVQAHMEIVFSPEDFMLVSTGYLANDAIYFKRQDWGFTADLSPMEKDIAVGVLRWRRDAFIIEVMSTEAVHDQDFLSVTSPLRFANAYIYCIK